jgi:hypothetical protein
MSDRADDRPTGYLMSGHPFAVTVAIAASF